MRQNRIRNNPVNFAEALTSAKNLPMLLILLPLLVPTAQGGAYPYCH